MAWATHPGGANTISTVDIVNGEVKTADIGTGEVRSVDVANHDTPNALQGIDIANGSLQSADLAPSALGARAYGRVAADGTLTRSKNVTGVTTPAAGFYCITLAAGIDPATAVMVVGPDAGGNATLSGDGAEASHVEWNSFGGDDVTCPVGTLDVRTYFYDGKTIDENDGAGNGTADILTIDAEPFAFVVPKV